MVGCNVIILRFCSFLLSNYALYLAIVDNASTAASRAAANGHVDAVSVVRVGKLNCVDLAGCERLHDKEAMQVHPTYLYLLSNFSLYF